MDDEPVDGIDVDDDGSVIIVNLEENSTFDRLISSCVLPLVILSVLSAAQRSCFVGSPVALPSATWSSLSLSRRVPFGSIDRIIRIESQCAYSRISRD